MTPAQNPESTDEGRTASRVLVDLLPLVKRVGHRQHLHRSWRAGPKTSVHSPPLPRRWESAAALSPEMTAAPGFDPRPRPFPVPMSKPRLLGVLIDVSTITQGDTQRPDQVPPPAKLLPVPQVPVKLPRTSRLNVKPPAVLVSAHRPTSVHPVAVCVTAPVIRPG